MRRCVYAFVNRLFRTRFGLVDDERAHSSRIYDRTLLIVRKYRLPFDELKIHSIETTMNYFDEKRVRSIPNIIRKNCGKFEKIYAKLGAATNVMEIRSCSRYDVATDATSAETNDNKSAAKQKTVGQNCRRRKQELGLKVLCEADLEWKDCASKTLCEEQNDGQDLDIATSCFQEATTDHQVPSASQLSTEHSPLEFWFDEETKWLNVQSSIEVELQEATELIPDIPVADEMEEAPLTAKETRRNGQKKLKSLSDFLEKENRDSQTGDESEVAGQPYCCWVCDKTYANKSSLRYHKKNLHGLDNRTIETDETSTKGLRSNKFTRLSRTRKIKKSCVKKIE